MITERKQSDNIPDSHVIQILDLEDKVCTRIRTYKGNGQNR